MNSWGHFPVRVLLLPWVTGNRVTLLFDGCDTGGLGDDDYNFCILSSAIEKVMSSTEIIIRQKFPIQYNPMRMGETVMVMNSENQIVVSAKINGYEETPHKDGSKNIPTGFLLSPGRLHYDFKKATSLRRLP